ncbi:sulfotransferase domain-containing protein [Bacteroidota bacterium]
MTKFTKPNLFIPGAAKSGTSSLHEYLNLHNDIFMSAKKEPHYFSHDQHYYNDEKRERYYSLFMQGKNHVYRGESSTGYMVFPNVIQRIQKDIENPKFIFILRNPVDRIFSHYQWIRSFGIENKGFREAIMNDMFIEPDPDITFGMGYKYYFQCGLYGKWLNRFFDYFDRKNLFLITTESLNYKPIETINQCFVFLGLPELKEMNPIISNPTMYYNFPSLFNNIKSFISLSWLSADFRRKIPDNLKYGIKKIKKKLIVLSESALVSSRKPVLTFDDRKWLTDLYYSDYGLLTSITGRSYSEWKDFHE